jgi:UDP-N-acetylglucosamine 4,6-dehydratase
VMISTDKAALPINTYGMTKALMERLVFETADLPAPSGTEFVACRYGNVIGSTGSIWPVFRDQFARQGYLNVTDPSMTRFFISIDDAVELIKSAFGAPSGTVVIPQPQSLQIGQLAQHLTDLWNAQRFVSVGARPGEKHHEDMIGHTEEARMVPYQGRYLLFGPTKELDRRSVINGMRSDMADFMPPAEFVQHAIASESI